MIRSKQHLFDSIHLIGLFIRSQHNTLRLLLNPCFEIQSGTSVIDQPHARPLHSRVMEHHPKEFANDRRQKLSHPNYIGKMSSPLPPV